MNLTPSPLRYPGGKTALRGLAEHLLQINALRKTTYVEAFAGGGGLALSLLFDGVVRRIVLNDLDPGIYSMWRAMLEQTDEFVRLIRETPVTIDEWYKQRAFYRSHEGAPSLELGFATLFLNRTNRSGVIKGGVIGGYAQAGDYKLDCRYSADALAEKVERVARYRSSIAIANDDAADFLTGISSRTERLVHFIDPPYFQKGSGLYTNFYTPDDHASLSEIITKIEQPWVLTYDRAPEISALYADFAQYEFDLNYSAARKRVGTELMVTSPGITALGIDRLRPLNGLPTLAAAG